MKFLLEISKLKTQESEKQKLNLTDKIASHIKDFKIDTKMLSDIIKERELEVKYLSTEIQEKKNLIMKMDDKTLSFFVLETKIKELEKNYNHKLKINEEKYEEKINHLKIELKKYQDKEKHEMIYAEEKHELEEELEKSKLMKKWKNKQKFLKNYTKSVENKNKLIYYQELYKFYI